jgi:hypothetical protein
MDLIMGHPATCAFRSTPGRALIFVPTVKHEHLPSDDHLMTMPIAPTSSRSASSASATGTDAVAEACAAAVEALDNELVFRIGFTPGLDDGGRAAAQLGAAAGEAPSVGMTGKGVFAANEPIDDGCVAVAFDKAIECAVGVGGDAAKDFRAAGHDAARGALEQLSDQAGLLMLLVDTRAGDLADAIAGAY